MYFKSASFSLSGADPAVAPHPTVGAPAPGLDTHTHTLPLFSSYHTSTVVTSVATCVSAVSSSLGHVLPTDTVPLALTGTSVVVHTFG